MQKSPGPFQSFSVIRRSLLLGSADPLLRQRQPGGTFPAYRPTNNYRLTGNDRQSMRLREASEVSLCVIVRLSLCYCRPSLHYCIVISSLRFEDFFHFPVIARLSTVHSARIIMRVRFKYAVIRPQVPYKSHRRICARKSPPLVAHHRLPPTVARARVSSLRSH